MNTSRPGSKSLDGAYLPVADDTVQDFVELFTAGAPEAENGAATGGLAGSN